MAATTIPWQTLDIIQKPLTYVLLPKMGIPRHMPRAVVHAPEQLGGLGIQQLSAEQGIAHVNFILGTIRAKTGDYPTLLILLESYIITAGIIGNPLSNMMAVEYIDAKWIETTRIFLNAIQATIEIPELNTIRAFSTRDRGIMATACDYTKDPKILRMINNCRLYLQVHTLAELTDPTNNTLHPDALSGATTERNDPRFWLCSTSTLRWPTQTRPPEKAWRQWRKYLGTLTKADKRTWKRKLGNPVLPKPTHRIWREHPPYTNETNPQIHQHSPATSPWTNRTFAKISAAATIDIIITSTRIYEETAFSWSMASDSHLLMTDQAKLPIQLYAGHNRTVLAGLLHAVTVLQNEFHLRHTPIHNLHCHVWLTCGKTTRTLRRQRSQLRTTVTATKCEDELLNLVIESLFALPRYTIHKITQGTPDHITHQLQDTIIQPTEISTIETTYQPPASRAALLINGNTVTANASAMMRVAYSSQPYRAYLQDKYTWNDKTIESIDWPVLERALTRLKGKQKHTIKMFIHGWLPTNAHPGQNKPLTHQLCPCCSHPEETNTHFRWCPNTLDDWTQSVTDILQKYHHPANAHLHQILHLALTQPQHSQLILDLTDSLPLTLLPVITEQTLIGWDQILLGRWSKRWVMAYDNTSNSAAGVKWACALLSDLWKTLITKWHLRCQREHDKNPTQLNRESDHLNEQITTIYNEIDRIDNVDKQAFSTPQEDIKNLPLPKKRAWLARMGPHLQTSIQRAKTRIQQRTQAITNFFRPRPSASTPNPIIHRNNRAHAEDFDPP